MKRFSDYEDYEEGVNSFDMLVDVEIIVHSAEFYKGDFGAYAVVEYSTLDDDTRRAAQTGAKQIIAELRKRIDDEDLPIQGKVLRIGRALRIG